MRLRGTTASLVVLLAGAVGVAGCGNQGGGGGSSQPTSGQAVFAQSGCAGCHTLAAAGAQGQNGPNLDELKPSAAVVERQVRNGGGGMPAFGDRLSAS